MQERTEYSEDNILIIKGRINSPGSSLYGQFFVIFNNEKHIDTIDSIISTYSEVFELEPHQGWEMYEKKIADWKWKNQFNNSMTAAIVNEFKSYEENTKNIEMLYDSAYNYDYDNMDVILYDIINRIIHDKNLELETAIQESTPEEFQQARESMGSQEEGKEEESESNEDETPRKKEPVVLPVKAVLSPVKGKPIYQLKIGDYIMVKIQAVSEQANYYIELMELKEDNKVIAAPAKVVDIKMGTGKKDPIIILAQIGPDLYGRAIEEEQQVKLKMHEGGAPVSSKSSQKSSSTTTVKHHESGSSFKSIIIMSAMLMIILLLLMVFILFFW